MKVIFTDTNNELAKPILGKECDLTYGLTAHFKFNSDDLSFDLRHGIWNTSHIRKIEIIEKSRYFYHIIIETLNSTYTFAHGIETDEKPLTDTELNNMAMLLF